MQRRTLLYGASVAATGSLSGCMSGAVNTPPDDTETVTPTGRTDPDDPCSQASRPLSSLLTDAPGDEVGCFDGATPSLAIENERDASVDVALEMSENIEYSVDVTLSPGERLVESNAFLAVSGIAGTMTLDGEQITVHWPDRSCRRHGIAIRDTGVEIGWIPPLMGPEDTQHDCYAGDDALLRLSSPDIDTEITVTAENRCAEDEYTNTFTLDAGDSFTARGVLSNGGIYDIVADVAGGTSKSFVFEEACWGIHLVIDDERDIDVQEIAID